MKLKMKRVLSVTGASLALAFAAEAEILMYDGFPSEYSKATGNFIGFTAVSQTNMGIAMPPQTGSYLNLASTTLQYPSCFSESPSIPSIGGGTYNRAINMSIATGNGGFGAKVMTLSANHQERTGTLHFRFLFYVDQCNLDNMVVDPFTVPTVHGSDSYVNESCGLVWSADDYTAAWNNNKSMRYTLGYGLGTSHNTQLDAGNSATIQFARGFMVGLHKNACEEAEIRLYAWGSDATDYTADVRSIPLATGIVGGKTYICYVQIEVDHFPNGDDRLCGMVQPTDTYSKTANWSGSPIPLSLRANLIGGSGTEGLVAHMTAQGRNRGSKAGGFVYFDEIGLATERSDLVVWNPPHEKIGSVFAFDSFRSGDTGPVYPRTSTNPGAFSLNTGGGFSASWQIPIGKSAIGYAGDGYGLSLPSPYAAQGIATLGDSAFGVLTRSYQAMYIYRSFAADPFNLTAGETVSFRFLMSVTSTFLSDGLLSGPDTQGTLITGTSGTQEAVNYAGAGLSDCRVRLETSNSLAPCLCCRSNSCFFTMTKGSDGKVGLYLNLLTNAEDAQTAYKIMDVGSEGGTYLCYAQIEVGTGTNGKEKIRAFACDVSQVTDKTVENWIPATKAEAPIEFELIDSASGRYPRHAMVGGSINALSFSFDEFAFAHGAESYPLVWARYPPKGAAVFLR